MIKRPPYRRAFTDVPRPRRIKRCSGSQFDPAVVERIYDHSGTATGWISRTPRSPFRLAHLRTCSPISMKCSGGLSRDLFFFCPVGAGCPTAGANRISCSPRVRLSARSTLTCDLCLPAFRPCLLQLHLSTTRDPGRRLAIRFLSLAENLQENVLFLCYGAHSHQDGIGNRLTAMHLRLLRACSLRDETRARATAPLRKDHVDLNAGVGICPLPRARKSLPQNVHMQHETALQCPRPGRPSRPPALKCNALGSSACSLPERFH